MKKNIKFEYLGEHFDIQMEREGDTLTLIKDGQVSQVHLAPAENKAKNSVSQGLTTNITPDLNAVNANAGGVEVAPMGGTISDIKITEGQQVKAGDLILIMEAMKMYIDVFATSSGSVKSILVKPGDSVLDKQPLLSLE